MITALALALTVSLSSARTKDVRVEAYNAQVSYACR